MRRGEMHSNDATVYSQHAGSLYLRCLLLFVFSRSVVVEVAWRCEQV